MQVRQTKRRRVIALLNAISDLHEGDLLAVLKLDELTPMVEFGEKDTFTLDGNHVIHTPGFPPPPRSLKHRARTGKELGRILEQQLMWILSFGEAVLPVYKKRRERKQLGGWGF